MPRILILHDYFLYKGGGERLVISLAKGLKADVATAFVARDAFDPRAEGIPTRELWHETFLTRVPGFRYLQVQLAFLFKTGFLKQYDVVIHSGDTLVSMLRAPSAAHIAYMHTPPRHLFDAYHERLQEYGILKKMIFIPFAIFNRWRFRWLSQKFKVIITNSRNTAARIQKYLGLPSLVVYPPCNTLPFKNFGEGDYFFSYARLYPIKRVHLIVEAFKQLPNKKLVVASGGPDLERLRAEAKDYPNIQILGWISDEELVEKLGHALATIYVPVREDFGMSPVESMTAGKPVIGVAEGGLLEVIEDGVNGLMLQPNFTVADLTRAVQALTPERAKAMENSCYATASRFTEKSFVAAMRQVIEESVVNK